MPSGTPNHTTSPSKYRMAPSYQTFDPTKVASPSASPPRTSSPPRKLSVIRRKSADAPRKTLFWFGMASFVDSNSDWYDCSLIDFSFSRIRVGFFVFLSGEFICFVLWADRWEKWKEYVRSGLLYFFIYVLYWDGFALLRYALSSLHHYLYLFNMTGDLISSGSTLSFFSFLLPVHSTIETAAWLHLQPFFTKIKKQNKKDTTTPLFPRIHCACS